MQILQSLAYKNNVLQTFGLNGGQIARKIKIPVVPERDNYEKKILEAILRCLESVNFNLEKRSNMVAF